MQSTDSLGLHQPRGAWVKAAGRMLRARARRMRDRRSYSELLALDDRILADIGVSRDMVRHELHKTLRWIV